MAEIEKFSRETWDWRIQTIADSNLLALTFFLPFVCVRLLTDGGARPSESCKSPSHQRHRSAQLAGAEGGGRVAVSMWARVRWGEFPLVTAQSFGQSQPGTGRHCKPVPVPHAQGISLTGPGIRCDDDDDDAASQFIWIQLNCKSTHPSILQ